MYFNINSIPCLFILGSIGTAVHPILTIEKKEITQSIEFDPDRAMFAPSFRPKFLKSLAFFDIDVISSRYVRVISFEFLYSDKAILSGNFSVEISTNS